MLYLPFWYLSSVHPCVQMNVAQSLLSLGLESAEACFLYKEAFVVSVEGATADVQIL